MWLVVSSIMPVIGHNIYLTLSVTNDTYFLHTVPVIGEILRYYI